MRANPYIGEVNIAHWCGGGGTAIGIRATTCHPLISLILGRFREVVACHGIVARLYADTVFVELFRRMPAGVQSINGRPSVLSYERTEAAVETAPTTHPKYLSVPEYQMLWASLNFLPAWVVSTFWSYAYMLWCHVLGLDDATAWGGRDKEQDSGAYPPGSNSTNHVPERPYRTQADAWAQRHVVAQALLDLWWAVVEQVRRSVRTGKLTWHLQIDFIEQSQHTQAVVDELNWGQLQLVMFTNRPLGVLGPEPRESGHAPEVGEGGGAKELSPMEERALHQAQAVVGIVVFWGRRG